MPHPNNTICPASASLTAFFLTLAGTSQREDINKQMRGLRFDDRRIIYEGLVDRPLQ